MKVLELESSTEEGAADLVLGNSSAGRAKWSAMFAAGDRTMSAPTLDTAGRRPHGRLADSRPRAGGHDAAECRNEQVHLGALSRRQDGAYVRAAPGRVRS